jgi:hypothetical protein
MFVLDIPRYHHSTAAHRHGRTSPIPLSTTRTTNAAPRNQHSRTNTRRLHGIRSLFSCMFPRCHNIHENRWDQCVQLDSRCKAMSKRLIVKVSRFYFAINCVSLEKCSSRVLIID